MLSNKTISAVRNNRIFSADESAVHHVSIIQKDFIEFKEGDVIYHKDDHSDYVYLIIEGKIKVKNYSEKGSSLELKTKDDYFGEKELIGKTKRTTAAMAESNSTLYRIGMKDFYHLLSKSSNINFNLTGQWENFTDLPDPDIPDLSDEMFDIPDLDDAYNPPPPVDLFKLEQELESEEAADDNEILESQEKEKEEEYEDPLEELEDELKKGSFIDRGEDYIEETAQKFYESSSLEEKSPFEYTDKSEDEIIAESIEEKKEEPSETSLENNEEKVEESPVIAEPEKEETSPSDIPVEKAEEEKFPSELPAEKVEIKLPVESEGDEIAEEPAGSEVLENREPFDDEEYLVEESEDTEENDGPSYAMKILPDANDISGEDVYNAIEEEQSIDETENNEAHLTEVNEKTPVESKEPAEDEEPSYTVNILPDEDEITAEDEYHEIEEERSIAEAENIKDHVTEVNEVPPVESKEPAEDEEPLYAENILHDADDITAEDKYNEIEGEQSIAEAENIEDHVIELNEKTPVDSKEPAADGLDINDYKLILDSLRKINDKTTFEHIRSAIVETCKEMVNAEHVILFVVDSENKILRTRNKAGYEIIIGYNESLAAYSAAENDIVNLEDVSSHLMYNVEIDSYNGIENKPVLCLPVHNYKENLIAVLQLFKNSGSFSPKEIKLLSSLMQTAALTIESALVHNHKVSQAKFNTLNESGKFLISNIKPSLKGVKVYLEHLRRNEFSPEVNNILFMINQYVDSVLKFGDTFLNYSEGKNDLKKKAAMFSEVVDDILGLLAEYSELRYCKIFKKYEDDGYVSVDKLEFYQVCFQIVKNACDAMPEGGNIYVVVNKDNDLLYVEFKDSGRGIPANLLPKILDPFITTKGNAAGLGLSLADKIMKSHGGKIICTNAPNEGAVFRLYLPII